MDILWFLAGLNFSWNYLTLKFFHIFLCLSPIFFLLRYQSSLHFFISNFSPQFFLSWSSIYTICPMWIPYLYMLLGMHWIVSVLIIFINYGKFLDITSSQIAISILSLLSHSRIQNSFHFLTLAYILFNLFLLFLVSYLSVLKTA